MLWNVLFLNQLPLILLHVPLPNPSFPGPKNLGISVGALRTPTYTSIAGQEGNRKGGKKEGNRDIVPDIESKG